MDKKNEYGMFALIVIVICTTVIAITLVIVIGLRDDWYREGSAEPNMYDETLDHDTLLFNPYFGLFELPLELGPFNYSSIISNAATPYAIDSYPWLDTLFNPIEAHSGDMIIDQDDNGIWWIGESTRTGTYSTYGINLYHTVDLKNFVFISQIIPQSMFTGISIPLPYCNDSCLGPFTIEKPRILYNYENQLFRIWALIDNAYHGGYTHKTMATFYSFSIRGPWTFEQIFQPEGLNVTDFTLFFDTDDIYSRVRYNSYLIYTADNASYSIVSLIDINGNDTIAQMSTLDGAYNNHIMINNNGSYYWIQTATNGWCPSSLRVSISSDIFGTDFIPVGFPVDDDDIYSYNSSPSSVYLYTDLYTQETMYLLLSDSWNLASSPSTCTSTNIIALPSATYMFSFIAFLPNGSMSWPFQSSIEININSFF